MCNSNADCGYSATNPCCCGECSALGFVGSLCMETFGCEASFACNSTCLP
jgi:hypothetical protein